MQAVSLTSALAIYAAVLSTVVFLWNLWGSRPRVRVRLAFGLQDGKVGVHASIQNVSGHDIHLAAASILYQDRQASLRERIRDMWVYRRLPRRVGWVHTRLSNYGLTDGFPLVLVARDAHHVFIPEDVLRQLFRGAASQKVVVSVQDKLWNDVYSQAFTYSLPRVKVDR